MPADFTVCIGNIRIWNMLERAYGASSCLTICYQKEIESTMYLAEMLIK
jgi:hypothetical protein